MIEYLEHHIVDHCNLNCAGCSHFSPLAQPWFEDLIQFKKDFSQLWDITKGNVGTIRLMGGEPLLHPQFDEFMAFTCGLFPHTQVQIVTNGILIGQEYDKLKDLSDKFSNFSICISTYGLKLNEERLELKFRLSDEAEDTRIITVTPYGQEYEDICEAIL